MPSLSRSLIFLMLLSAASMFAQEKPTSSSTTPQTNSATTPLRFEGTYRWTNPGKLTAVFTPVTKKNEEDDANHRSFTLRFVAEYGKTGGKSTKVQEYIYTGEATLSVVSGVLRGSAKDSAGQTWEFTAETKNGVLEGKTTKNPNPQYGAKFSLKPEVPKDLKKKP
jgi:hypothetical protein